jgi:hypothetical protein
MEPAADQVLLAGSYSSALDSKTTDPLTTMPPPATSTLPLLSNVVVPARGVAMEPAEDQVFATGSYNSALAREPPKPNSPVTNTLPLARSVAE